MLLYSQASTQLQKNIMSVNRPSVDKRLVPTDTRLPEPTCANSRHRSHLDHFLATRLRNSQQAIQGTVFRSNRGGTSTAIKNKRKTKRIKTFYTTTNSIKYFTSYATATECNE